MRNFSSQRFKKLLLICVSIFWCGVGIWAGFLYFTQDLSWIGMVWRLQEFPQHYKEVKEQYSREYNLYNSTDILSWFDWKAISSTGETIIELQKSYGEVAMSDPRDKVRKWIKIPMDRPLGIRYEDWASITGFILRLKDTTHENYSLMVRLYHFHPLQSKPTLRYLFFGGLYMGENENDKNYFMKHLYVDIMSKRDVERKQYGEDCLQFINGNRSRFWWSTSVPTNVMVDNCRVFIYKPSRDTRYDYESSQTYLELNPGSSNMSGTIEISLQLM